MQWRRTCKIKSLTQWNSGKCSIQFNFDGLPSSPDLRPPFAPQHFGSIAFPLHLAAQYTNTPWLPAYSFAYALGILLLLLPFAIIYLCFYSFFPRMLMFHWCCSCSCCSAWAISFASFCYILIRERISWKWSNWRWIEGMCDLCTLQSAYISNSMWLGRSEMEWTWTWTGSGTRSEGRERESGAKKKTRINAIGI